MATKPTIADAEWATDALMTSAPDVDEQAKSPTLDPGTSYRKQGWIPNTNFIGRYMNWILNQFYLWAVYLNDLHNSTAFLSQAYTWTGAHTFNTAEATFAQEIQANGGIDTNGGGILTGAGALSTEGGSISSAGGNISSVTGDYSSSGGDYTAAGGSFTTTGAGAFQCLNASGSDTFAFTGTKPSRTIMVNMSGAHVNGSGWIVTSGKLQSTTPNANVAYVPLKLPHGATVTGLTVAGYQNVDTAADTLVQLMSNSISGYTMAGENQEGVRSLTTGFGGSDVDFPFGSAPSFTVDNTDTIYYLKITECDSSGVACGVNYVKLTIGDPGPRNF